jgi:hypothetical protein
VERDESRAKFWLQPIRLQDSTGFRGHELRRIEQLVEQYQSDLLSAWDDFFGPQD